MSINTHCSPGKISKKVEVVAIELFFALSTSKRYLFQHIKSLPKSAVANLAKNTFLVANTEYDNLLNNFATELNIEMQEVIIRMLSWSVYVLKTFIEKSYRYFIKNIEIFYSNTISRNLFCSKI